MQNVDIWGKKRILKRIKSQLISENNPEKVEVQRLC